MLSVLQFLSQYLQEQSLSPAAILGGSALILFLIAIPVIYYILFVDTPNAPPQFPILNGLVKGRFNFKELGPLGVVSEGYKQMGDIFRIQLLHQRITVFIGPAANKIFFEAKDEQLSQKEVYTFTVPVFGDNIVYDADRKYMQQQLKFVSKGLNQQAMMAHVGKIVMEAEAFFKRWPDEGECDLMAQLSELIIKTAARCLLGREIRENVQDEFAELYQQLSDGMSHLSFFWPHAPTAAHKKRDEARKKICAIFNKVIAGRRKAAEEGKGDEFDDFLQVMVESRYTDGTAPTDDEICGLLLAALFAGQHTSNITSTWMGLLIMQDKKRWLTRVLEEQKVVMEKYNNQLSLDGLNEMSFLHNCMKETLRLYPPLILLMRKVLQPIQYGNYIVPKGDIAVVCPPISHQIPAIFTNPSEFNPDRFEGENAEDLKQKFAFLAFGGGRHSCLGERFGFLQVKTIWSVMSRMFDFEVMQEHPKADYGQIVVGPKGKCMIRFRRKKGNPYQFAEKF
jgi:sterol 14-demethylase